MRKTFFIILFLQTIFVIAQQDLRPKNLPKYDNKLLHFGFTLGLNTMDFRIKHSSNFLGLDSIHVIENNRRLGFNISIVSSLRLAEYLDLRFLPGLSFGQRDLDYTYYSAGHAYQKRMKIESTFIDFPFVIKYKAKRIANYRPYVIGGVNSVIDLASQKEVKEEEKPKIRLNPLDVYYQFGFGVDFYLTYFKFSTEIKFGVGLLNVLRGDGSQYTRAIDRLNSNVLYISFHFE